MANPYLFYENRFETGAYTSFSATSEASGFPKENLQDWRPGTAYRWKGTSSSDQFLDLDMPLAGNKRTSDTLAISGHNLGTVGAAVEVFADGSNPPITSIGTVTPANDLPLMIELTSTTARYWRVAITSLSAAPQIGVLCMGRRLEFPVGILPGFDPYNRSVDANPYINNNGSPIGVNVRQINKTFSISYGSGDPGFLSTWFDTASASGFDDYFLPHAVDSAKPFFFAWNLDTDSTEVYLSRIINHTVSMPFIDSTLRRGLNAKFMAYRETS